MSGPGSQSGRPERQYRLDGSRTVERALYTLYALGVLLLIADLFYEKDPSFGFEGWFGFHAWVGLISAFLLVLVAMLLRRIAQRDEDYYEPDDEERRDRAG